MANTAEELGRRYEITREQADEFGYRSHRNARLARDASGAPLRVPAASFLSSILSVLPTASTETASTM